MNIQKTSIAAILTCLGVLLAGIATARAGTPAGARVQIVPEPKDDLQIWIWPDRGEGATYHDGEPISFYVEATRDCFLILYDIDTRGRLQILFPADPWDDNFVTAGERVRLPRPQDPFDWRVDGPPGVEYVQAIASEFPIDLPDWPVYLRSVNGDDAVCPDPELRDFRSSGDRLGYIETVNHKITGRYWDWCATDLATFQVEPCYIHRVSRNWDPWPDSFYGEIYIGWPLGGRIYIDGVYIGVAPLFIPRHLYGRHVVTCYDGSRLLRRHYIDFQPKRAYRYAIMPHHPNYDVRAHGHVKAARRGAAPGPEVERNGQRVFRRSDSERRPRIGEPSPRPTVVRDSRTEDRSINRTEISREIRTGDVLRGRRGDAGRSIEAPARKSRPAAGVAVKEKQSGWLKSVAAVVKGAAEDLGAAVDKPGKDHRSERAQVGSRSAKPEKSAARASDKPSGSAGKKARPKRD
jgi:hypothetical protein